MSTDTSDTTLAAARTAVTQPDATTSAGLLVLRLFVGLAIAGHGSQKLFGWFGGDGLAGTADFFESVGFTPGQPLAVVGGLAEFGGGLLIVLVWSSRWPRRPSLPRWLGHTS